MNVIQWDTQTRAARKVHIHFDATAEHDFSLKYPFRDFASRSACGACTDDDGESPAAPAQGNGWFVLRGTQMAGGPSLRAALPSRRGSLSAMRETCLAPGSGGQEHPQHEYVWTWAEAVQAASKLFGDAPIRRIDGQQVPCGVGAAALALAWLRPTESLCRAVRYASCYVLEDAIPVFFRAISAAADCAAAFDLLREEVERLRQVAVVPHSPVRFDGGDILGRRDSCDSEDEEEPPSSMRRRSLSLDADGRGPARG